MNALAEELNKILDGTAAFRLLSESGKRMYFPKGILSQSAEATEKAHRFNATIGMAWDGDGPMILDAIRDQLPGLSRSEAVAYAPTAGVPALRKRWKQEIGRKNPSLKGKSCSLPVVVPGLTAGVSFLADLFMEPGDAVVLPEMFWPNYRLIMEERKGAMLLSYPMFDGNGGFNVKGFSNALEQAGRRCRKILTILNFPNNPTGYSPTLAEADAIVAAMDRVAASGVDLLVIADDAYFGLQYEDGCLQESIFARMADRHPSILAAKVDGPTKEDYVWGFRAGFITFSCSGMTDPQYEALMKKLMGVVRSAVSNTTAPTQYILLKALDSPGYADQKLKFRAILEERYHVVKRFVESREAPDCLRPLPFNSGYFMSFECSGISAEGLRLKLLNDYGIGTISMQEKWLRVAFSSVAEKDIDALFADIYEAARKLSDASSK
ncbi:MAG: aminotransferase class I/II-fold pyridoxal phosphate-dependent enzyme [Spirochaetes bacterium]|nr:aminotransferase class I/II-fold pyridoxal phosphate-dependent enzyme [Spirochaetota bacterium]